MFYFPLIIDSGKRMLAWKVTWFNSNKQGAVCVFSISCKAAHSVYDNALFFTCCGNYCSSGAHTECICASFVQSMAGKLIISRPQLFMTGKFSVLSLVDQTLRMLYSCADGKRLLYDFDTEIIKHFNGISCTMSDCHYNTVCLHIRGFAVFSILYSLNKAIINNKLFKLCFKPNLSAEFFDFFTDIFDYNCKSVCSDMRL